jgi:hypothetical protein
VLAGEGCAGARRDGVPDAGDVRVVRDQVSRNGCCRAKLRCRSRSRVTSTSPHCPGFREALMTYLASSYDEIRAEDAS